MLPAEFRKKAIASLGEIYDNREAASIVNMLLEDVLNISRIALLTSETDLTDTQMRQLENALERLMQQEPLQYVLGYTEFYGLRLQVNPSVLIPRPETEELVEWMLHDIHDQKGLNILDVGTGSGCIPLALKHERPDVKVAAVDISEDALQTARANASNLGLDVLFTQLDVLNQDNWGNIGRQDIIVSNPPYITRSEFDQLETHVKDREPEMALIAPGDDPFIFYRILAMLGKDKLPKGGYIYLELNAAHAETIRDIFIIQGYSNVVVKQDMQGKERMLRAELL